MAVAKPAVASETWVERACALEPLVAECRDDAERLRCLPDPVLKAMKEAEFFSMWVPASLGGAEVDVQTMVRVTEELARQDGSVGWNNMIAGNTAILWAFLAPEVAGEMMHGDPNTIIAGTILAGAGQAVKVPNGYRVTGHWPFASGCQHADWLSTSCIIIEEDGNPRLGPNGEPSTHTFVLPASDCEILDTWYTTGLRGTGSHDFEAKDVFVPAGRTFPSRSAPSFHPGPLYNTAIYNVWGPNVAAVALGVARDALDTFRELAETKRSSMNRIVLRERESIQEKMGEAEAALRSGRAFLFETMRDTWPYLSGGRPVPESQAALNRLATATAVRNAIEAVDIVYTAAGSSSIYTRSRLERCFRDVHMVSQHGVVGPGGFQQAGRALLGLGMPAR